MEYLINPKLQKAQNSTIGDAISKLEEFGMCAIIRPTGFGKNYMTATIMQNYISPLFIYPTQVIHDDFKENRLANCPPNTRLMSYTMFGKQKDNIEEFKRYLKDNHVELIAFDECHFLGAKNVDKTFQMLRGILGKEVKILGMTATPYRMDRVDVVEEYFNGHSTFDYTINNAIEDKIIEKPYYVRCAHNCVTSADKIVDDLSMFFTERLKSGLKSLEVETANKYNVNTILRNTVKKVYGVSPDYMKFICFYSRLEHMEEQKKEAEQWFKQAFPWADIRSLVVTSEQRKNVDMIKERKYRQNTIDLIFAIDMLNFGIHMTDITGVIMVRGTGSSIIYSQQIGRALSVQATNRAIIIDLIDNINRPFAFTNRGREVEDKDDIGLGEVEESIFRKNNIIFKDMAVDFHRVMCDRIIQMTSGTLMARANEMYHSCGYTIDEVYYRLKRAVPREKIAEWVGAEEYKCDKEENETE